jgi:uncharacterized membrane protein YidH (DUF202 family)
MSQRSSNEAASLSTRARDHMANERTFLAWMRTSIGVMAFGFVVEKFSIFMEKMAHYFNEKKDLFTSSDGFSRHLGIYLVALGALIGLLAYVNYLKTSRQLEDSRYQPSPFLAGAVTLLFAIVAIVLIVYLIHP